MRSVSKALGGQEIRVLDIAFATGARPGVGRADLIGIQAEFIERVCCTEEESPVRECDQHGANLF